MWSELVEEEVAVEGGQDIPTQLRSSRLRLPQMLMSTGYPYLQRDAIKVVSKTSHLVIQLLSRISNWPKLLMAVRGGIKKTVFFYF